MHDLLNKKQLITHFSFMEMVQQPLFLIPFFISLPIALLVPENIFQQYPLFADFYSIIKNWFPWTENHAEYSSFPNTTRLFFAVNWLLLPIQVFALTRYLLITWNEAGMVKNLTTDSAKHQLKGISPKYWVPMLMPLLFLIMYSAFYLGKDPGFAKGLVNDSRLGMLLIWSFCTPVAFSFLLGCTLVLLKNFKKIYFNQSGN